MAEQPDDDDIKIQIGTSACDNQWFNWIMNDEALTITGSCSSQGPKLHKVPQNLRNIESNKCCYDPMVVSIGPYHRGNPELSEMEEVKVVMTRQFVRACNRPIEVYEKVEEVAGNARQCYVEALMQEDLDKEQFTQMMFLDGCFVLQFIFSFVRSRENLIQVMNSSDQAVDFVKRDLLLLENQLPFQILQSLMSCRFSEEEGKTLMSDFIKDIRAQLLPHDQQWKKNSFKEVVINLARKLLSTTWSRPQTLRPLAADQRRPEPPVLHLLQLLHFQFVGRKETSIDRSNISSSPQTRSIGKPAAYWPFRPAVELKKAGINLEPSMIGDLLTDIKLESKFLLGKALKISPITIDDSTKCLFLNLIALEAVASPKELLLGGMITSYICFMASLIDDAQDVKRLRSKGVILSPRSDQQIANLFNEMANYLVPIPGAYADVKRGIESQCKFVGKLWLLLLFAAKAWDFIWAHGPLIATTAVFMINIYQQMKQQLLKSSNIDYQDGNTAPTGLI